MSKLHASRSQLTQLTCKSNFNNHKSAAPPDIEGELSPYRIMVALGARSEEFRMDFCVVAGGKNVKGDSKLYYSIHFN